MANEPTDIQNAKEVIEKVAFRNGVYSAERRDRLESDVVDTLDNLKSIAGSATKKLAQDLYSKKTHFVLECIQNADDNSYASGVEPRLRFSLDPNSIQIDCNEIGFKEAHVRALCSVGKSTKTATSGRQEGYIGEKGIGFKSVFKVAQRVLIRSPPYSFDLDQTRDLGMITPCWVPPEVDTTDGYQTRITLFPNDDDDFSSLAGDFRAIKPTLLIFLRRLRFLEIIIPASNGFRRSAYTYSTSWEGNSVTLSSQNACVDLGTSRHSSYNVYSFTCENMPSEKLREQIETSKVVLAFPLDDDDSQPLNQTQAVHAFLPVRDYGFKFLIQADFLVTSNRQDVNEFSPWNSRLRDAIVSFFKTSMSCLRKMEALRYTWIRYLPQNISNEFWAELEDGIMRQIRHGSVLESRSGQFERPKNLKFLDNLFLDREKAPLVGRSNDYISPGYVPNDTHILERLGVRKFTWDDLVDRILLEPDAYLSKKPMSWHEDIASAFSQTPQSKLQWVCNRLRQLPLIPMQNGRWVKAATGTQQPIYFGQTNTSEVPSDIHVRVVDSRASKHKARNALFEALGVRHCNPEDVAALIFGAHQPSSVPPSRVNALQHAQFLFSYGRFKDDMRCRNLWLYDSNCEAVKAKDLYFFTQDGPYSPSALLKPRSDWTSRSKARFLHPDYDDAAPGSERTRRRKWFKELGVSTVLKLEKNEKISPDFACVMQWQPELVLRILKCSWDTYRYSITDAVAHALSSHKVRCYDGTDFTWAPLEETFAPSSQLRVAVDELCESDRVPFLYLEGQSPTEWSFLAQFNVGFHESLAFYLWLLDQDSFIKGCTVERAQTLYQRLASFADRSTSSLNAKFQVNRHVYLFDSTWANATECVWDAPRGFEALTVLKPIYGKANLTSFFKHTLGIKNASVAVVIGDLVDRLSADADPADFSPVYGYISDALLPASWLSETDRSKPLEHVRKKFGSTPLLLIQLEGNALLVKPVDCVWLSPIELSEKHVLESDYSDDERMSRFLCQDLAIGDATANDVCKQLCMLKRESRCSLSEAEAVYAYLACRCSKPENIRELFESWELIYVPDPTTDSHLWCGPSRCVWDAPSHLTHVVRIANVYSRNENASTFLQDVLGVRNVGVAHYIEELRHVQRGGSAKKDVVEQLYQDIQRYAVDDLSLVRQVRRPSLWRTRLIGLFRKMFRDNALVYVPSKSDNNWRRLEDCVWRGVKGLRSKTSLSQRYERFHELFQSLLGVEDATPEMLAKDLVGISKSDTESVEERSQATKELLMSLKSFVVRPRSLRGLSIAVKTMLQKERVWPCLSPGDESPRFLSSDDLFFAADRDYLLKAFGHMIPRLDLDVAEVHNLKPLLEELQLCDRLLSQVTTEVNSEETQLLDRARTQWLRVRSDALLRCACHYGGKLDPDKMDRLHEKLNSTTVYTADRIIATYTIDFRGFKLNVNDKGFLRVESTKNSLKVYVPSDVEDANCAYYIHLPKRLIATLNIPEDISWQAVVSILSLDESMLGMALDRIGIPRIAVDTGVPWTADSERDPVTYSTDLPTDSAPSPDPDPSGSQPRLASTPPSTDISPRHERPESNTPRLRNASSALRRGGVSPTPARHHANLGDGGSALGDVNGTAEMAGVSSENPWTRPSRTAVQDTLGSLDERRQQITASARHYNVEQVKVVATASRASFSMASLSAALPATARRTSGASSASRTRISSNFGPRSTEKRNRDFGIGYEGELFVVEVLKGSLEGFTKEDNWTSKLREYAGVSEYRSREITDVTYKDTDGKMTEWISRCLDHGENEMPSWLQSLKGSNGPWPTYYLEVKSTTDRCETPFFISRNQFHTMKRMSAQGHEVPEQVYVIVRVFESSRGKAMQLYVDPWNLRALLDFQPLGYSVTPRSASGVAVLEDDGMEDDGMEDDGMEDDGMEDDGMEDDGMEDELVVVADRMLERRAASVGT